MNGFLERFRPTIVVLSGDAIGMEFALESRRNLIGRGPGVDLALDHPSLAREHAEVEFADHGFRLRTRAAAPARVNGAPVTVAELKPGDRFWLGEICFGFELEPRGAWSDEG
jgi:hypothetical protein